jgi:hypothetical protein
MTRGVTYKLQKMVISTTKKLGGGTRGDWQSQGLDLSQLPMLTMLRSDAHGVSSAHS